MKKKLLSILLATVLTGSLAACGESSNANSGTTAETDISTDVEETANEDVNTNEEESESPEDSTDSTKIDTGIPLTSKDVTVSLGDQNYMQIALIQELGWFDSVFGENNITIDVKTFSSGPEIIESFTANELQVGLMGMQPVISAAGNGVDIKVLETFQNSSKNNVIAVPADSDIKSVADLKGKTVATLIGSNLHSLLVWALAENGLSADDVNIINTDFTAAGAVLESGEADAVSGYANYLDTTAAEDGVEFTYLLDATDSGTAYQVIVADSNFAEEYADIVENLIVLFDKASDYIENNEDEALQVLSNYYGTDIEVIRPGLENNPVGFASEEKLTEAFNNYIDFMSENDLLYTEVKAEELLDFSYFEETGIVVEDE